MSFFKIKLQEAQNWAKNGLKQPNQAIFKANSTFDLGFKSREEESSKKNTEKISSDISSCSDSTYFLIFFPQLDR